MARLGLSGQVALHVGSDPIDDRATIELALTKAVVRRADARSLRKEES
jgi:hypothetical protein